MADGLAQQYLWLLAPQESELRKVYTGKDPQAVQHYLEGQFPEFRNRFSVRSLPSLGWEMVGPDKPKDPEPGPHLVVSVSVEMDVLDAFRGAIIKTQGESSIGADLSASPGEYFCPATVDQVLFGNRQNARDLIHAEVLSNNNLLGDEVNVVIVDHGLDAQYVPNFQGGWKHTNPYTGVEQLPGHAVGDDATHGLMMVRNIVNTAPNAKFWDLPLIPPRIWDVDVFINDAQAAFDRMLDWIKNHSAPGVPWVLVNAWAIFDRSSESPMGDYTNNPSHPFNLAIARAVNEGRDVIFCAGNCGQFCPDGRCGSWDIGPGQSVLGANSHRRVISVGAVRTDALWLGYSSQGPGQPSMARLKPDFCAPSNFAEIGDDYTSNTGTSAASGVTAGVVAALRSRPGWGPAVVSPNQLRRTLARTARKIAGPLWDPRLGHGILDAGLAFAELSLEFP